MQQQRAVRIRAKAEATKRRIASFAEHLYRALRKASNPAPAAYLYSNYGFGLLGHLLSHTAGRPYGELLAQRVTGPLGLTETTVPGSWPSWPP